MIGIDDAELAGSNHAVLDLRIDAVDQQITSICVQIGGVFVEDVE